MKAPSCERQPCRLNTQEKLLLRIDDVEAEIRTTEKKLRQLASERNQLQEDFETMRAINGQRSFFDEEGSRLYQPNWHDDVTPSNV